MYNCACLTSKHLWIFWILFLARVGWSLLWPVSIFCLVSILCNLSRLQLWTSIWLILVNMTCSLERIHSLKLLDTAFYIVFKIAQIHPSCCQSFLYSKYILYIYIFCPIFCVLFSISIFHHNLRFSVSPLFLSVFDLCMLKLYYVCRHFSLCIVVWNPQMTMQAKTMQMNLIISGKNYRCCMTS